MKKHFFPIMCAFLVLLSSTAHAATRAAAVVPRSGCVVYSYIGSTGARLTLGIHTGASGSGTRYYTKANEVNAALGTSRY